MATAKDYQRIPTPAWTVIQQAKYTETLHSVALEDGTHLRTSSMLIEIHVAPINCSPEDGAWGDITYTFLKADRLTGLKADISNLEPVHVAKDLHRPCRRGFQAGRSRRGPCSQLPHMGAYLHPQGGDDCVRPIGVVRRGGVELGQAGCTLCQLPSNLGGGDGEGD